MIKVEKYSASRLLYPKNIYRYRENIFLLKFASINQKMAIEYVSNLSNAQFFDWTFQVEIENIKTKITKVTLYYIILT